MKLNAEPFRYDFAPGPIRFGRNCTGELGDDFAEFGFERALVITGTNVGANDAVMDPVTTGLGDRLADVFAETTPAKSIRTAYDALDVVEELDVDALVGVGAGSSLDIATVTSALHARYRSISEIREEVDRTGGLVVEDDGDFLPLVFIPTTLTGADLSAGAGIKVPGRKGEKTLLSGSLTMTAGYYDPDLFETTPTNVLIGSAMNSFDKGIEALYSRHGEPITDATAIRGLRYLQSALPRLREADDDPTIMERAVLGGVLAQFGVTVPHATKLAVVHAICHALRHEFGIQQGIAHALVVPHALRWVLNNSTGGQEELAEAFDVRDADDTTEAIVEAVTVVRDSLGLPGRLRDVDGVTRDALRETAEIAREDAFMWNGPADLDPTVEEIEEVLRAAW